jgi:hypothetical protein
MLRSSRAIFSPDVGIFMLLSILNLVSVTVSNVPVLCHIIFYDYENVQPYWQFTSVRLGKGKGKAVPLQAWRDPEGFRRLRLPDFKTYGT